MFFRYGIFGCVLWGYAIAMCYKSVKKRENGEKPKLVTTIPLWTMIAVYMFLSVFHFGYVGFNITLTLMAMYLPPEEEESDKTQHNAVDLNRSETFA